MSLIRKPGDIQSPVSVKILVYGQPGIGKTTLGVSTPSPLLLDFDGGVHRVNPIHTVDTVQISKWEDCIEVLKEDLSSYKTIVVDTVGKMLDYMTTYIIKSDPKMGRKDGALSLQGYGVRKVMFVNFLKQVSTMGKHLVFVAHEREDKDGDNRIIRPEIGGSSSGDLIKEIDLVGYMEAIGKKRTISFDPCEKFYGKNTCGLDQVIAIQEAGVKNVFLSTIIEQYANKLDERKAVASKYTELIENIQSMIQTCDDADGMNEIIESVPKMEHLWDSKIQASHLIKARATELGFTLNKSSHKYETQTA